MEIQKIILVILHLILIYKSVRSYLSDRGDWEDCKYPVNKTQIILFTALYSTFILNLLCLLLKRLLSQVSFKYIVLFLLLFIQFCNIILCIVLSVLVGLTIHKDDTCPQLHLHQFIITIISAFVYWLAVCCITGYNIESLALPAIPNFDMDIVEVENGLSHSMIERILTEKIKDDIVCSICLENIQIDTSAKVIPGCQHKFHVSCITPWLLNNAICPYCRRNIVFDNID